MAANHESGGYYNSYSAIGPTGCNRNVIGRKAHALLYYCCFRGELAHLHGSCGVVNSEVNHESNQYNHELWP
jgi:hypothetical protein